MQLGEDGMAHGGAGAVWCLRRRRASVGERVSRLGPLKGITRQYCLVSAVELAAGRGGGRGEADGWRGGGPQGLGGDIMIELSWGVVAGRFINARGVNRVPPLPVW